MITTAAPDGEAAPALFVLDMRDRPWDGSSGLRLTAERDGIGMAATQSHAKEAVAELAEASLGRLARVIGGGPLPPGPRTSEVLSDRAEFVVSPTPLRVEAWPL